MLDVMRNGHGVQMSPERRAFRVPRSGSLESAAALVQFRDEQGDIHDRFLASAEEIPQPCG